ncbi:hypothetical protein FXO37_04718 [Capsicum annuum]|nr:hypothetical protein FXO37_04718 [Capsicum annuum]
MVETTADKWSGLFSQNRSSTNGMPLSFFPLVVVNGKLAVQLGNDEIEQQTEERRNALILYSTGETPSYNYMQNYLARTWNNVASPKLYYHDKGYFLVKFKTSQDRDDIYFQTTSRGGDNPPRTEQIRKVEQVKKVPRGRNMVQQWRNRNVFIKVATKVTELKEVRQTDVASEEHNFPKLGEAYGYKTKQDKASCSSSPPGCMRNMFYSTLMQ